MGPAGSLPADECHRTDVRSLFLRGPYGPVVTGMTAWQAAGPYAYGDSLVKWRDYCFRNAMVTPSPPSPRSPRRKRLT